jgi:hypothetical protein
LGIRLGVGVAVAIGLFVLKIIQTSADRSTIMRKASQGCDI